MKKLLLLILFVLNLVLLQAQSVEFILVNSADTTLENITFKRLPKLLQKDSLTADPLATPAKWMVKLNKKLRKEQRADSNIYIFFCHNPQDSEKAFLPLSGKYGYVLFDTAKTGVVELEKLQKKLSTHKYQWDLIHDPESMIALFQDEEEGAYILSYEDSKPLFLEKLYNDILKSDFHIYDIWDEERKTAMLNEVRSKIKKVFYITVDGNGSTAWDYKRFFTELGVDVDNANVLDLYQRFKDDERYVHNHSMANYVIEQLNTLFLTETDSYDAAFNEFVKSFYDKKKAELGTLTYKWIDGRNGEVMDPRTYYGNDKYNFSNFENDVKEFVLIKETKCVNSPNRENETLKLTQYNVLLSMFGEYMYRIGIQEIPDMTQPKVEELKPKFYNYWKLTEIRQGKYEVE